jgi:hypothetical protein
LHDYHPSEDKGDYKPAEAAAAIQECLRNFVLSSQQQQISVIQTETYEHHKHCTMKFSTANTINSSINY